MNNTIKITHIKHNNFQDISIEIEKNKLIVFTGPSGSGKSTLAMDIIYAESQRKFIESLPSYARQFIGLPEKADIEEAIGLSPAIAIDQKTNSYNTRSTVGTVSEIYEYIRILYTTIGVQHCWSCLHQVIPMNAELIGSDLIAQHKDKDIAVFFMLDHKNTKDLEKQLLEYIFSGCTLFLLKNTIISIRSESDIKLLSLKNSDKLGVIFYHKKAPHDFGELKLAIQKSFQYKDQIAIQIEKEIICYNSKRKCTTCKREFPELSQRLFSFNLPTGACAGCKGLGINEQEIRNLVGHDLLLLVSALEKKSENSCEQCHGGRLNKNALSVYLNKMNIFQFCQIPLSEYKTHFEQIKNAFQDKKIIVQKIFREIEKRIDLLLDLGLGYLTLHRNSNTLSGGELQRIRLAGQLGSALTGVTYILDEPSIGLHQRDNIKLIQIMKKLRDLGNTVIVIEHDDETMLAADYLLDIGPGAGLAGGKIIFQGSPKEILSDKNSITGKYLSKRLTLTRNRPPREIKKTFTVIDAKTHNLKNITVEIPLEIITVISGVSGSGKSTFIFSELLPQMKQHLHLAEIEFYKKIQENNNKKDKINTTKKFEAVILVDQSSLGRTSRSTIGTYLGLFDHIRELFASLPESKIAGFTVGSFSFNTGTERCQKCSGKGSLVINMEPLPSTTVDCQSCEGKRYNKHILGIRYKNKNIYEILEMTILEALNFFILHKKISRQLEALCAVGLGYITLDQSSDTFSGGEAQRIKLAYELNRRKNNTVYILDEPTTGLHFQDIKLLLSIFDKLIEKGNTIIVIEHNMSVIRYADYVIEIGPEGGDKGGYVIAKGTPEEIKENKKSITGKYI